MHGNDFWFMLQCCAEISGSNSSCNDQTGNYGQDLKCPHNQFVSGGCSSGMFSDCKNVSSKKTFTELTCCENNSLQVGDDCFWRDGGYGSKIQCPVGSVQAGFCGAGNRPDCYGSSYVGVYCCKTL